MTVEEMLKNPEYALRLSSPYDGRWLSWDEIGEQWIVYESKPRARRTRHVIETEDLQEALKALVERAK